MKMGKAWLRNNVYKKTRESAVEKSFYVTYV